MTEQTEIAKKLGISNNAFRRFAHESKLEFKLINNKRHYKYDEVLEVLRKQVS